MSVPLPRSTTARAGLSGTGRDPWRYRLHRAGIRNVWQYDDAEFLFGDGRLLLRGKNGAGKSKALEMLLPFLLDGDTRALDATGTGRTSLSWLMLDGAVATNRLGYLWLELRRTLPDDDRESSETGGDGGDEAAFLTLGAAVRASRTTGEAKPLFFVTPLRVGHELRLVDGAQPLPIDRLRAAVGEAATYDTAKKFRARVARDVFGLADTGRYRNLVHLLHRLRRPTVGDRVEAGGLADLLAEALPPIDEETIDDVAHNLDDLDAVRAELARLTRTDEALRAFLAAYRGYLHGVLRRRAGAIADDLELLRQRRRAAGDAERTVTASQLASEQTADALGTLREAERLADADLRALRDSTAYQSLRELRDRRGIVTALDAAAAADEKNAVTAAALARSAGARVHDDTDRITAGARRLARAHTGLVRRSQGTGVDAALLGPTPRAPLTRLTPDVSTVDVAVVRAEAEHLGRRLRDVRTTVAGRLRAAAALRDDLRLAAAARTRAEAAEATAGEAETRAGTAADARRGREEELLVASVDYADATAAWCADPRIAGRPDVNPNPLLAAVAVPGAGGGGDAPDGGPGADAHGPAGADRWAADSSARDRALSRELPAEVEGLADELLAPLVREVDAERDEAVALVGERDRGLTATRRRPAPPPRPTRPRPAPLPLPRP
ncbi:conserved hypothetical protein [Frankia canadensis]|uniref:TIGR02680 family protein n=1 Tax=Frankia canadensis TaxID=1836972 RepID=A0A2I2KKL4_9ACTN|nr:hypothetical protein [Frankia canadensis]SNQ46211.1 conserved hypothetical protein [Frankia canadensis]SOU53501.1 conserved hypothetical protein [Frankia canadensis]